MDNIDNLFEKILKEEGWYDDAIGYEKAIKSDPDNAKAHYNLGNIYLRISKYDEAIKYYEKSIELDPYDSKVYYYMGYAYYYKGNYDEAIRYYKKCIEIDPFNAKVGYCYFNIGLVYERKNNDDEAIKYCKKAIETNYDGIYYCYSFLGNIYLRIGNDDEAIKYFEKSIELMPNTVLAYRYYNSLGVALQNNGNFDDTIKCYEVKPNIVKPYCDMGFAYCKKRNFEKAIKCYDEAIKLNPNYSFLYGARADIKRITFDYAGAIEDYSKAIEISPLLWYYEECIETYKLSGDYENARKMEERKYLFKRTKKKKYMKQKKRQA